MFNLILDLFFGNYAYLLLGMLGSSAIVVAFDEFGHLGLLRAFIPRQDSEYHVWNHFKDMIVLFLASASLAIVIILSLAYLFPDLVLMKFTKGLALLPVPVVMVLALIGRKLNRHEAKED